MRTWNFLFLIIGMGMICGFLSAENAAVKVPGISMPMEWINPPLRYEVTKTGITITSGEKTDKYIAPDGTYSSDNANRLVFNADKDFTISASISHPFASKWDGGAIILESDASNWIKFCFEKDYTGAKRVVSVVTKGISDDCNSVEIMKNQVYYQLAKKDDTVYLYVSKDGKGWYLVRTLNFKSETPIKIGLLAQSPEGKSNIVAFTSVKYQAVRIKDFWKGE